VRKKPVRHSDWNVKSPDARSGLGDKFSGALESPFRIIFDCKYTFPLSHFLNFKTKKMAKSSFEIINPHCAGIDIGSRSHFVAVGQELTDLQEFGVYADDLVGYLFAFEKPWHQLSGHGKYGCLLAKFVCGARKTWF
jgi:hypothetical protein